MYSKERQIRDRLKRRRLERDDANSWFVIDGAIHWDPEEADRFVKQFNKDNPHPDDCNCGWC